MNKFDPLKAARDMLAGLVDVSSTLRRQERAAEERMSNAERDLNEIRKLRGYLDIQLISARARVEQLELEAKQ